MSTLVFLEQHDGVLTRGSLCVLGKAVSLGGEVAGVVVGSGDLTSVARTAGAHGATKVHVASDDSYDPPLPQPRVDVLEQVVGAGGYTNVVFANSVLAADVAAGLAARLDAGLNWDLTDLEMRGSELVGKRLALQDSVLVEVGWKSEPRLALFRNGSFEPVETGGGEPEIDQVSVTVQEHSQRAKVTNHKPQPSEGPGIEAAEVVVAGGIGLGSAENMSLAEDLAGVLGGAVGATRAVVYKGWYPYASQIGQTGKTVTPKLYIALGISGAVQHKVGMQNSKTIVSINKDPNAPIFEFSDLGVVGDVHNIVPQLVQLLKERKG
jgi:electron transfer flavoprotein alpha subunit